MAWAVDIFDFPGNYTKSMIMEDVADYIERNGDYGSSYVETISDKIFGCEDDVMDFLYEIDDYYDYSEENLCEEDMKIINEATGNGYRDAAVAVKYLSIPSVTDSYLTSMFANSVSDIIKEHTKCVEDGLTKLFEQSHVECPNCNSSLNTKYLTTEKCPLCKQNIIFNENIEKIKSCEERINALARQTFGENTKAEIKWAVAFGYHY